MAVDLDVASITAIGTAIATVILSIAPLVRAFRERGPDNNTSQDEVRLVAALPSTLHPNASGGAKMTRKPLPNASGGALP